jgi:hypothetical protein
MPQERTRHPGHSRRPGEMCEGSRAILERFETQE